MNVLPRNLLQKFKLLSSYSLLAALPLAAGTAKAENILVENVGFATPESAEYFADEDVYLVNNINGSPFDKDDNGFISKVSPDGKVIELKWIDGAAADIELDAPKGMSIVGNKLYVADIDTMRVFDLTSGKAITSIKVNGSSFLNGVSADEDGNVYITDTGMAPGFKSSGTDAIYKITSNGDVETILKDPKMGRPNGILYDHGDLYVVFFSSAKMIKIDKDGKQTTMLEPLAARLDGLVKLNNGGIAMSSWEGSSVDVYRNGDYETIIEFLNSPADMGVDSKRNRLLIPLFNENKLVIAPLDN